MAVSDYVIAAICGCFKRESLVNPGVWESLIVPSDTYYHVYQYDGIGGFGFGQFTNTTGQGGGGFRLGDYYDWCLANNKQPDDGSAQMDYIVNVERLWFNAPEKRGNYNTLDQFLATQSTNLYDLTWDWLACWEGVPGNAFQERYEFAQRALAYINQHKTDNPSQFSWVSGNFYATEAQMFNNVMCLYFWFSGYSPVTHPGNLQDFIQWCIDKCNDANVGYSQQYREEQTVNGITYYDCSSFVWYGLKHTGFDIDATSHPNNAFITTQMPTDLPLMGWVEIDGSGELKPGDIGVSADHTEVVYQGGTGQAIFMGAHSDAYPLPEQVSISNFVSSYTIFDKYYRFMGGVTPEPEPKKKKKMPLWMYMKRRPLRAGRWK